MHMTHICMHMYMYMHVHVHVHVHVACPRNAHAMYDSMQRLRASGV